MHHITLSLSLNAFIFVCTKGRERERRRKEERKEGERYGGREKAWSVNHQVLIPWVLLIKTSLRDRGEAQPQALQYWMQVFQAANEFTAAQYPPLFYFLINNFSILTYN